MEWELVDIMEKLRKDSIHSSILNTVAELIEFVDSVDFVFAAVVPEVMGIFSS